ncbi:ATPase [Planomonospora sphaerica]|uniref:ATPase n=1 Tax=Planomonospora sphaerica TaxID=161355 RepID=A0A171BK28_9ACTN|nr:ATP-binding protein [Planomonospora sphaerica]GAT65215.1 ATPase [Planomonospora sphaerica]
MPIMKPERIFDRDADWRALVSFVEHAVPEPALGVVSGRRRQGKTYLLTALAEETGGFYFGADESTGTEALRLFGAALARFTGAPAPIMFAGWDDALDHFFSLARERPIPLIIDEFPLLMKASPELPSILQRHLDRRWHVDREPCFARVLLCGSAMSVMGRLLAGQAPLRGRAGLELVVKPLRYRSAAAFWGADDPGLAALLHAVVGGTPAYGRQFVRNDTPGGPADFDDWVCRTVLNPQTPLFREARYLLAEEVEARDPGLYHSVLGAIAAGNATNGGIAAYVGRKSAEIAHPLHVLEDCQLIVKDRDLIQRKKPVYRIAEPLITFYQAVMRPRWAALELGEAERVWRGSKPRFLSQVVGPDFEQICRDWAILADDFFDEPPGEVGSALLVDHSRRENNKIQLDVVVMTPALLEERQRVLSLGEVKWDKVMGLGHLERLRRARDLLIAQGHRAEDAVLACYSGAGFDEDLRAEAHRDRQVLLVDLPILYG